MSYQPTGGITDYAETAMSLFNSAKPALQVGVKVLSDPYLPEAACEVMRMSRAQAGESPGSPCPRTTGGGRAGVGLKYAVTPLRLATWHFEHPYVLPILAGGTLALIFYAGFKTGKGSK